MKVTYIYHSGFLVETEKAYYIFDYYMGDFPAMDVTKEVWVFASHCHKDHYNKKVFELLLEKGYEKNQIRAVLSKDIFRKNYPEGIEVLTVRANETHELANGAKVETLLSTDLGVAFYVTTNEGSIFHAGDLNDWRWNENTYAENRDMQVKYERQIGLIEGREPELAFVPLDPRQEEYCGSGLLYFLEHVSAKAVYPMHYWEQPKVIGEFLAQYPKYQDTVVYTE